MGVGHKKVLYNKVNQRRRKKQSKGRNKGHSSFSTALQVMASALSLPCEFHQLSLHA